MTMFWAKIIKRKFICHYFLTILIADKRLTGFDCIVIANGHILHNMWWWLVAMVKIYGVIGNIRAGYLRTEMWIFSHHFVNNSHHDQIHKSQLWNERNLLVTQILISYYYSYQKTINNKKICGMLCVEVRPEPKKCGKNKLQAVSNGPCLFCNVVFFLSCDCRILNPSPQCVQKSFRERMCIRRNAS